MLRETFEVKIETTKIIKITLDEDDMKDLKEICHCYICEDDTEDEASSADMLARILEEKLSSIIKD